MNINTTDKVQVGDSTTGTSTSTTTSQWQTYKAEKGWECPRCGRINAPWVRQCDCSRSNWSITYDDLVYKNDKWWKDYVTCQGTSSSTQVDSDTFKIHPESTIYTTNVNQVVGGSDYKDSVTGNWVNIPKTYTNSVKR